MADERERQTSNKAGVRSLGQKLGNSRYGFDEHPGSRKTAGAFGKEAMRGAEEAGSPGRGKQGTLPRMKRSS